MEALTANVVALVDARNREGWTWFSDGNEPGALVCWSNELRGWLIAKIDAAELRRVERLAIVTLGDPRDGDAWRYLDGQAFGHDRGRWLVDADRLAALQAAVALVVQWEQPTG